MKKEISENQLLCCAQIIDQKTNEKIWESATQSEFYELKYSASTLKNGGIIKIGTNDFEIKEIRIHRFKDIFQNEHGDTNIIGERYQYNNVIIILVSKVTK